MSRGNGGTESFEMTRKEAAEMYEKLARRARRGRVRRPFKPILLAAAVVIGTAGGFYGLTVAFNGSRPTTRPVGPVQTNPGVLLVVFGGPDAGIYSMEADGTGADQLEPGSRAEDVAPSPDGKQVAFVGSGGIFVVTADGTNLTQLTTNGSDTSPTWSPDGQVIAFSREIPGDSSANTDIFVVPATGGEAKQLTTSALLEYAPAWSPDGAHIALAGFEYGEQGPTPVQLYVMQSDGSGVKLLGGKDVAQPAWSPDGAEIAFVDGGSLSVISSDGTDERTLYETGSETGVILSPSWSPDGTRIAFVRGATVDNLQVYIIDEKGGAATQVTEGASSVLDVAWAPQT